MRTKISTALILLPIQPCICKIMPHRREKFSRGGALPLQIIYQSLFYLKHVMDGIFGKYKRFLRILEI